MSTLAHRLTVIHLAQSGLASNAWTTLSVSVQSNLGGAAPHPASGVTSAHQLTHLFADLAPKHLLGRAQEHLGECDFVAVHLSCVLLRIYVFAKTSRSPKIDNAHNCVVSKRFGFDHLRSMGCRRSIFHPLTRSTNGVSKTTRVHAVPAEFISGPDFKYLRTWVYPLGGGAERTEVGCCFGHFPPLGDTKPSMVIPAVVSIGGVPRSGLPVHARPRQPGIRRRRFCALLLTRATELSRVQNLHPFHLIS